MPVSRQGLSKIEPKWVAGCEQWSSSRYQTEAQAQRKADELNHGGSCPMVHGVVQVTRDDQMVWRDENGKRYTS